MNITSTHVFFWDGPFSQWYTRPSTLPLFQEDGVQFLSAEHYMMYNKAALFNDMTIAAKILKTASPRDVKALGRQIKNFDSVVWDKFKLQIVIKGNLLKFSQNTGLLTQLLEHADKTFVEASPYDKIWGIGLDENDERCLDESKWLGQNLLGKALDVVAHKLKGLE